MDVDGEGDAEADTDAEVDGEDDEDADAEAEADEAAGEAGEGDMDDEEEPEEDEEEEADESDAEAEDADGDDDDDDEGDEEEASHADLSASPRRSSGSRTSPFPKRSSSPTVPPLPPYKIRRSLIIPAYPSSGPPTSLSIDAIVAIPIPSPIHCLAATACASYLLTGSQEGVVRAYDFYGSVNGSQAMTAQQRAVAGVGRGWWVSDVAPGMDGMGTGTGVGEAAQGGERRAEPVYSLAVEGDGLWALTGTQSGPINMYTLRHSPGHLVHSLRGHSSVVSCMALTTDEKRLLSGSWDGSIREWDLNTGQTSRAYPTHGAQLSSLSLRPSGFLPSPSPTPPRSALPPDEEDEPMADKPQVSVVVGPDFFKPKSKSGGGGGGAETAGSVTVQEDKPAPAPASALGQEGDVEMGETSAGVNLKSTSRASSYDDLFNDEDAEGETVPPSAVPTQPATPLPQSLAAPAPSSASTFTANAGASAKPNATAGPSRPLPSLALPGVRSPAQSTPQVQALSRGNEGAAATIPLLTPTTYKQFSDDVLLASFMDGQVMLVDRRVPESGGSRRGAAAGMGMRGVGRLMAGDKAPPWCMSACWSGNGNQILAGRRNGTVDIWDVRRSSSSTAPNLLRTLKTPAESGAVSCLVAFPDGQHVATASQDNIRLWNTVEYFEPEDSARKAKSRPPFKIVAGHHGGTVSAMLVDPTSRFMTVASGDRGWAGESTKVVLIHEVKWS
ncbi:WD40-repeat-containing domain protein [Dioszegia hungarica]|uniref:WD40-repeat-containing domain protein n=1 Tax=Dioszegia hungarica TaxID=4972 RepID=A0AA38LXF6_9TREE|nr:WD40-repeat-containing domain protein [Dioszegia hungarica]KAI9637216.1 WD40-repeat-containing domain protein [Dioszegia hungarica]